MKHKIVIFAFDFPYPPNRGGRADIWRRIQGLVALGCEVMLVCWRSDREAPMAPEHRKAVEAVVTHLTILPTRSGLIESCRRLVLLPKYPSHVSSRLLTVKHKRKVSEAMADFDPTLVWCEGPYPGAAALWAADLRGIPLAYRSHNVEHLYMHRQACAARGLKDRLAWRIACLGLRRWELGMIDQSSYRFDVSSDDINFWLERFGRKGFFWLPPIPQASIDDLKSTSTVESIVKEKYDVVFLGNLTTPNNIRGVEWLVTEIVPLVLAYRPGTSFLIAGSNPASFVVSLCRDVEAITLIANPEDALEIYRSARVLINPVRSGSGIHVKSIEMLMLDAPVVSSTQGTQGMPESIKACFYISDDTAGFASAIVDALHSPDFLPGDRSAARESFGLNSLQAALTHLADAGVSR